MPTATKRPSQHPRYDLDWWVISLDNLKRGVVALVLLVVGFTIYFGIRYYLDYREQVARAAAAAGVGSSEEPEKGGYFLEIEGDVKVKKKGAFEWVKAEKKQNLNAGDMIKTGASSSAHILLFDGTEYTIKSESLTMIQSSAEDPQSKVRNTNIRISSGAIDMTTAKKNRPDSKTELSSPTATTRLGEMTVAGVTFNPESEETSIQVYRGSGEVRSGSNSTRLDGQEAVSVSKGQEIGPKVRLLPPPDLIEPANLKQFAFPDPSKETIYVAWRQVQGARNFHLLLAATPLFSNPLVDYRLGLKETAGRVQGLVEGTYFWKVAALDQDARLGEYSPTRRFRILAANRRLKSFDVTPPVLKVEEPRMSGNIALVRGQTEPGVLLTVNGEQVDVDNSGAFFHPVIITKAGKNDLVFVAQDASGNESRVTKTVNAEFY
ncbi:MAG: FecR domain-containing protein [Acidobacteriota bacterium]